MLPGPIALFCDIDLTLLPSMQTALSRQRQTLIQNLYDKLEGAFALITGRPASSLDKSFAGELPASVEHHAAWRAQRSQNFRDIAAPIDSNEWAIFLHEALADRCNIFLDKEEIASEKPGVFIEQKRFSLALVFSPATPQATRMFLQTISGELLKHFRLNQTHKMFTGTDAVEIMPIGPGKAGAVRDFMATNAFYNRAPLFIGDGPSDAVAMELCHDTFQGCGIAVGPFIADDIYVRTRLNSIDAVWDYLDRLIKAA